MRFFTLLKANMKRQRRSLISLFILIFIITVSLCTVLTIWKNSNIYETEEMERLGFGEIACWINDTPEKDDLIEELNNVQDTQKVEEQPIVYAEYIAGGMEAQTTGQLVVYDPTQYDYHICEDNLLKVNPNPEPPQKGEIYISPAFTSIYHVVPGEQVGIKISEDKVKNFIIKGYFEDPFMGSSMMGVKTMLICEEDKQDLLEEFEEAGQDALGQAGTILHIFQAKTSEKSVGEYLGILNRDTTLKSLSVFTYQKVTYAGFMLFLQNIFSGFLLVFVTILLTVAIIVMSHCINSNIEQNYVNLGIQKATGFSLRRLRILMLEQYLSAILVGMLCGLLISEPVVRFINKITVTATGLMIPSKLPIGLCLPSLLMITALLTGIILNKTVKIGKISPIRAIRGGAQDVYFKSKFSFPIKKKGTEFWLALRQLSSGKKQYIGVVFIALLLVFFMSVTGRSREWMGSDGQGLMNSFGATSYDIQVMCKDPNQKDEVDQYICENSEVEDTHQFKLSRATIKDIEYLVNITDEPEKYHIISGRTCLYDNEMVITESAANELEIQEGDTVAVTYQDHTEDFIVTGINQCANDMGDNFAIGLNGYERLGGSIDDDFYTFYKLKEFKQRKPLMDLLQTKYGDEISMEENTWTGLGAILGVMSAITKLMYIISAIFILVVTEMTGSKILYKEQHDLGIYKSLGFAASKLRKSFALRFGIAATIGSILGAVAGTFLTNPIVTIGLKACGISSFNSEFSLSQILIPVVITILVFTIFAYMAAAKIKKVEPTILIID